MKYLYLLVLLLLLTVETSAQTSSDSSGLAVLQKKWRPLNPERSFNSELDKDPFTANNEANQANQDQKDYLQERKIREKAGLPPVSPRVRVKPIDKQSRDEISILYNYQIKVQNSGTKVIEMVVWDYVFFDSATNQELGRHQFVTKTNLKPHETRNLVEKIYSPPTGSINARDAGKKLSDLYIEQVNIKSIQYTDGSAWQADSK